jgi:hypothetical protein
MPRSLTADAQTKMSQILGSEPIVIVRIDGKYFSSKAFTLGSINVEAKLGSIGELSTTKKADGSGSVSVVQVVLIDNDATLKTFIDANVAEGKACYVYHHYQGNTFADLLLIFKGVLTNPSWSEGTRTFSFDIESKLHDREVGFAPDEDDDVPEDVKNREWPLCFGNVIDVPAVRVRKKARTVLKSGYTTDDTSFLVEDHRDFPLDTLIKVNIDGLIFAGVFELVDPLNPAEGYRFNVKEENLPKYEGLPIGNRDSNDLIDYNNPVVFWLNSFISIVNHYIMVVDEFGYPSFARIVRQEERKCYMSNVIYKKSGTVWKLEGGNQIHQVTARGRPGWITIAEYHQLKYKKHGVLGEVDYDPEDPRNIANPIYTVNGAPVANNFFSDGGDGGPDAPLLFEQGRVPDGAILQYAIASVPWQFEPGTEVKEWKQQSDLYVCNLIPSNAVVAVRCERGITAEKRIAGGPRLNEVIKVNTGSYIKTVPNSYYTKHLSYSFLGKTVTMIEFPTPLDEYEGQGWDADRIYVVLRSSIGPNTVDIIEWILENYSSVPVDATSFAAVAAKLTKYPSNFALFQKRNAIQLCEEIAFQARCGLVVEDGTAKLTYLSEQPASQLTYAENKVEAKSLVLDFSPREDIITKLTGHWESSYYEDNLRRNLKTAIYTNNHDVFGVNEREEHFYIYNIASLVEKSVRFWGIRWANSWRRAKLNVNLLGLKLELFDGVTLQFTDTTLLNAISILGVVEKRSLDIAKGVVNLDVWLPSIAGSTSVHPDAWMDDTDDETPDDPTLAFEENTRDVQYADIISQMSAISAESNITNFAIVKDATVAVDQITVEVTPRTGTDASS